MKDSLAQMKNLYKSLNEKQAEAVTRHPDKPWPKSITDCVHHTHTSELAS